MTRNRILLTTFVATVLCSTGGFFFIRYLGGTAKAHGGVRASSSFPGEEDPLLAQARLQQTSLRLVSAQLSARLSFGDPREKIERVLREQKTPFYFNAGEHRYEIDFTPAAIRKPDWVTTAYLYVDGSQHLRKIETQTTFTTTP